MAKIKLKIQGMSCQHCVKTVANTLTGLEGVQGVKVNLRKNEAAVNFDASRITTQTLTTAIMEAGFQATEKTKYVSLKFLAASVILLFNIIGCSDVPYTGPILTVDNVDRYLDSTGEDTVCLQDGFDSICIKLVQEEIEEEVDETPIVHIYPTSLTYLFYYEDRPILRAERVMDTTEIMQDLIDAGKVQPSANDNTQGNDGNIGSVSREWVIQIYYPDSFPDADRGVTPETSGFDIRIVEGMKLKPNKQNDLEIKSFTQIDGLNGIRLVQFSIETESQEITIQVDGLVPEHTATFYINADDMAANEDAGYLQLEPLQ